MKVLYVSGSVTEGTPAPIAELAELAPAFDAHSVTGAAAALVEIRTTGGYDALFIAPDLPHNEALALIASLRRDRVPIAVVAIVTESQQDFFAPAVTAGADDVLLVRGSSLVSPADTLVRIRQSRYLIPDESMRPLQVLYAGDDDVAWDLIEQMPFLHPARVACTEDGTCALVMPEQGGASADVVIIDEHPGAAHPLQAVKGIKARSPETTVLVMTSPTGADIGGAALDLGADDVVSKAGVYRRRLVAALHRFYVKHTAAHEKTAAAPAIPFHPAFGSDDAVATVDASSDTELEELRAALADAEQRLGELEAAKADVAALREALDAARADQDRGRTQVDQLNVALADAERRFAELESAKAADAALQRALEAERAARAQDRSELDDLRASLADAERRAAELEADKAAGAALQDALDAARAARAQDESELERLRAALADAEQVTTALDAEREGRERERSELDALRAALASAERRVADLEAERDDMAALRSALDHAREDQERDRSELDRLRASLADAEQRYAELETAKAEEHASQGNLEQEYQNLVDAVGPLRTENAALTEALGFERAMRDRDRTELESAKRALAETREKVQVLDDTLRQTEERAEADLAALRTQQTGIQRSLEERLAVASERLHAVANESQALQMRLEDELAARAAAHDRVSGCDVFGHAIMRLDGTLLQCNDAFARMFGYGDAAEATHAGEGGPFPGTAGRPELDARLSADGRLSGVTTAVRHADGHQFYVLESATLLPSPDDAPPMVERMVVEAGDRARLDAELRLARRLESAGRLAAEVAPEIEPLLANIERPSGATDADRWRATALVRQLLAFARRQSQPAGFLSLNDAVRRTEPLLRRIVGDFTDFQIRLAADLDAVAAGEADIEQLLTSLVFAANALLPMSGAIVLETSRAEASADAGPGSTVTVTASGYGLRTATLPEAVETAAARCGGHASLATDDNRAASFRVTLR